MPFLVNNSGNVDNFMYIRSGIETIKVNVLGSEMVATNFNISMAKRSTKRIGYASERPCF